MAAIKIFVGTGGSSLYSNYSVRCVQKFIYIVVLGTRLACGLYEDD